MAESQVQQRGFFGWSPVVQNMSYSVRRFPSYDPIQEELIVYDSDRLFNVSIPNHTEYTATRNLSDNATPIPGSPTHVYARPEGRELNTQLKLAFDGEAPCGAKVYGGDLCSEKALRTKFQEKLACFPGDRGVPCNIQGIHTGTTGSEITSDFRFAGLTAARYYADHLKFMVEHGRATATRFYDIDEKTGETKRSRSILFDAGILEKYQQWVQWRQAQRCDGVVKSGTAFVALSGCADFALNADNVRSLVGKSEPSFSPAVERILISDEGADGTTDSVDAGWLRALGKFEVEGRSTYTQGMLTYFDGFWQKVRDHEFQYRTPSTPLEVSVKKGDSVSRGTPLFTYQTNSGIRTFHAEIDGSVSALSTSSEGGLYLAVEAKIQKKESPSFLKRCWRYIFS